MKNLTKKSLIMFLMVFLVGTVLISKDSAIPDVKVKNLKGKKVSTKTFNNDGKPYFIMFWATWCKPCIQELKAVHEVYPDWQDEYDIKIYAVSIDDSRNSKKVAPFVKGRAWEYEVFIDENSDFRRAMNVNNPPHTFLIDGNGKIAWQHNGYAPGDEEEMIKELKKLLKKK